MASWDDSPAVVFDNGSGMMKGGFAGDEVPRQVFPATVGVVRSTGELFLGDDVLERARNTPGTTLKYPLDHGIVVDWDSMERVWRHTYSSLGADPASQAVMLTEAPMNPKKNRERMAEVIFESVGAPAMHIQIQAVLALYAAGRTEGLVVDSGDGVTHVVPIYDGHTAPGAVQRLDMGGRDLTEWMMEILTEDTERPFTTARDREIARHIKETHGYVAADFEAEMALDEEGDESRLTAYKLPDGQTIQLGRAKYCCAELMFDPTINEKPCHSIQRVVKDAVSACAIDIRRPMLRNIILSGGTTTFSGFDERLRKEVSKLVVTPDDVHVIAPPERKYSVWMGGALLASLSSFSNAWILQQEYQETGSAIVHSRCDALDFTDKT